MTESSGRRQDAKRRQEILDTAFEVLAERGYKGASMLEIARRASASKETLYAWFGSKRGLFEELILRNAEGITRTLGKSLEGECDDPAAALEAFGRELLKLLLGPRALVVNRAAIAEAAEDATFGRLLVEKGRNSSLPRLVRYLEMQRAAGRLRFDDAEAAADSFLGLLLSDLQIRRLLGVLPRPSDREIKARAKGAVRHFLTLFGPH